MINNKDTTSTGRGYFQNREQHQTASILGRGLTHCTHGDIPSGAVGEEAGLFLGHPFEGDLVGLAGVGLLDPDKVLVAPRMHGVGLKPAQNLVGQRLVPKAAGSVACAAQVPEEKSDTERAANACPAPTFSTMAHHCKSLSQICQNYLEMFSSTKLKKNPKIVCIFPLDRKYQQTDFPA